MHACVCVCARRTPFPQGVYVPSCVRTNLLQAYAHPQRITLWRSFKFTRCVYLDPVDVDKARAWTWTSPAELRARVVRVKERVRVRIKERVHALPLVRVRVDAREVAGGFVVAAREGGGFGVAAREGGGV